MKAHEALAITGTERFSQHQGFGPAFRYLGPFRQPDNSRSPPIDPRETPDQKVVRVLPDAVLAMDALLIWVPTLFHLMMRMLCVVGPPRWLPGAISELLAAA